MNWNQIRSKYPNQWLVVEAIVAHTDQMGRRIISDFNIIEPCLDGISAFNKYRELHKNDAYKEYYYLHTSREIVDIEERKWVGIRIPSANPA